ncbi:HNH endonuclease signature motif containing protein [Marihabitans asiaticum]|uniref:Uncharacterized protein DUF222 n=1 Tax=Marihabitans asiaticum TaxID=415218 RepID=A0A560WAM5_9MICO|nr:DUF222 domain-containing protein [Marihabitans asiaticum]TWD14683.1 uncharacterized protein DUF222 [Marihabitans asiaticum]
MSRSAAKGEWDGPPCAVARELLDWLTTVGQQVLDDGETIEMIELLERAKGAAAAAQARLTSSFVEGRDAEVAALESGREIDARTARQRRAAARSEVALARRCSPSQADRHVGLAKALTGELPQTMAALTKGEISEWRATLVARGTACLSAGDRREADRRLSPDLRGLGDRGVDAAARRVAAEIDAESVVERHRRAVASRHVSVRPAPDGMAFLTVLGRMVDVVGAKASLDAAEQARWVSTGDAARDAARAADDRGRGAWMADTALALLSGRGEGEVQPVEVGLVMTPAALLPRLGDVAGSPLGRPSDPAEVPGWGPVPAEIAREQIADLLAGVDEGVAGDDAGDDAAGGRASRERDGVWIRRLFTDPSGRNLVGADSRRRLFSGGLRRLLALRDPTCRIPWCDAPTRHADHVDPASTGGATSSSNGAGECARHNYDKEAPGWSVEVLPGSGPHTVRVHAPTGSTHDAAAPPLRGHGSGPPAAGELSPMEAWVASLLDAAA